MAINSAMPAPASPAPRNKNVLSFSARPVMRSLDKMPARHTDAVPANQHSPHGDTRTECARAISRTLNVVVKAVGSLLPLLKDVERGLVAKVFELDQHFIAEHGFARLDELTDQVVVSDEKQRFGERQNKQSDTLE
jgi:hypothetical protein